jgi:hypothetical protein
MDWSDMFLVLGGVLLVIAMFARKLPGSISRYRWQIVIVACLAFAIALFLDWPEFVRGFNDGRHAAGGR